MTICIRSIRIFGAIFAALGGTGAHATPLTVFDNLDPSGVAVFGPTCCQVGNQVTLAGSARTVSRISWSVSSQNQDVVADVEAWIYANDGVGGAPGALLWSSGVITDVAVSPGDSLLDFMVPAIIVPDVITVTTRISAAVPVGLGRVEGSGSPGVGGYTTGWIENVPGTWNQQFGPWGMRITAVTAPEPGGLVLVLCAGALLVAARGRRFRRRGAG